MASAAGEWNMSRPSSGVVSPRPMRSRTQSLSSDRPSITGYGLLSPPLSVTPEAAFIAASAASQIVTNDHDGHADLWCDQNGIVPSDETALVSPGALQLVNSFLDQLLFSFLQVSKGTTLATLRPAVSEVLKPKLAKDAINNADEELREYLGGADEDDYTHPQGQDPSHDWDLELVWKRTRLRCMVYSSLGDMEEEEEDLHMEQENLDIGADESAYISPAVAIFLTSVLEYMGELTLTVAGQASWNRIRSRLEKDLREGTRRAGDFADPTVVEDLDMERVALDRTLGRLWRGWKKRIRSPTIDFGHSPHRGSISHVRHESDVTDTAIRPLTGDRTSETRKSQDPAESAIVEDVPPADIPLPMGDNDVAEIEVPGLVDHSDDEVEASDEEAPGPKRPKSLLVASSVMANGLATRTHSEPRTVEIPARKRSNSVPSSSRPALKTFSEKLEEPSPAENENEGQDTAPGSVYETPAESSQDLEKSQNVRQPRDTTSASSSRRKSRHSNMITGPEAAALKGPLSPKESTAPSDSTDAVVTYERAEIMTSSRISVAGSSSTSLSEYGKPLVLKRSSSVHSARLIDVHGPKSPTSSRDTSLDPAERVRPVSISRASSVSVPSASEESRKPRALETVARTGASIPPSRSPVDRIKPSLQNAATISESDEELDTVPSPVPPRETSRFQGSQPTYGGQSRHAASSRQEHGYNQPPTRSASYNASSAQSNIPEDSPPAIPRKAPGHPSRVGSRTDTTGQISIERTRSRDSDEDITLPLQPNLALKQTATTGSTGSSAAQRHKAIRTSEDNSSRADDMARTFEELIQSNQTITYTLTPENMRDIDRGFESPVITKASRKSEENRSHYRSRSSSGTPDSKTASSYRAAPLNMHPVSEENPAIASSPVVRTPTSPSKAPNRGPASQARDARTPSESMSDFASFIRGTGPPGDDHSISNRNAAVPKTPVDHIHNPRRGSTASNRGRYQPREAVADSRADNSDLIDFIRQGPPGASINHRIPRHVAPFRNTMDSDQFNAAIGGRAIDATIPEIRYSQASTNVTEYSMPSMHSSVNSSSALLKNRNSPAPTSNAFNDEDMMPKKKTRRVRDPYAIDFSDEEDGLDGLVAPVKPPPKKEESLAEFLRNYQPPPEPEPPAVLTKQPKKKASAPSLITRFARGGSSKDSSGPAKSPFASDSRSLSSRLGSKSGHVPIQVQIPPGYDAYGPMSAASSTRETPTTASPRRVPMKKFEPREAVSTTSRTSDLASFLRDSGPPVEPAASSSRTNYPQEESNSFSKMFGRKKKTPLY